MNNAYTEFKADDLLRDVVQQKSSIILILGRFGISLGFGDKTIYEVCRQHQVDVNTFLEVVNYNEYRTVRYESISLTSLIGYLKNAHEYFLEFNLPNIRRKLIESIDCSGGNEIGLLIIKFYDEYVKQVKRHMDYENKVVFTYVEKLLSGIPSEDFSISAFEGKHEPISFKLKELKDVITRYYPQKNNYLLNEVLLNIISCEEDLGFHCMIEDNLFVPAVKKLEISQAKISAKIESTNEAEDNLCENILSVREKDILICIAKGLSNKQIAEKLFLSVHTVATHKRNICSKLNIHTSVGLAIYAISNQLVVLEKKC